MYRYNFRWIIPFGVTKYYLHTGFIQIKLKLLPNTIDGLLFGLSNFDGIETDIRLTKDEDLVLYHDPVLASGEVIRKLTLEQLKNKGIPSLLDFLSHEKIPDFMSQGKVMWIEFKSDCKRGWPVKSQIVDILYSKFTKIIDQADISPSNIKVLSFYKELLAPVVKDERFQVYPIIPYVNECNTKLIYPGGLPRILMKSLKWHMKNAVVENYNGVLFAKQYLMGIFSLRHPKYEKIVNLMDETGIELGTNLGRIDLEANYNRLHRFSDNTEKYPRYAKKGEGLIIAHRGTGTKGVEITEN